MELLGLPAWLWWLIVAVVLVLIDLFVLGAQFILVAAALAAVVTAGVVAVFGVGAAGQAWTFVIGVLVLTPIMIHQLRRRTGRRERGPNEPGWERGRRVQVVARGDRLVAKLRSDEFPVQLADGTTPREGETLVVDRMEGITLVAHRPDEG